MIGILLRLRQALERDALALRGVLLHASMSAVAALSGSLVLTIPAMLLSGAAWILTVRSVYRCSWSCPTG